MKNLSLIDTHAHVHDPQFDADRDAVVRRAREAQIGEVVLKIKVVSIKNSTNV